jgi:serine phosphatase RsbU (regulator of sigma subunit)
VVEARTGRELFGLERLDAVLAAHAGDSPQAIAEAVIEACRAHSGGNLTDDCAVVVIKR